uniref:Uncharacterized protein n=1 Tax=Callorhinchus milii TaxID=7868 RepID=A0A4W3HM10_CALMI
EGNRGNAHSLHGGTQPAYLILESIRCRLTGAKAWRPQCVYWGTAGKLTNTLYW